MRQRRILPGELIQKDLVALARPLLDERLHDQATLLFLLLVAAVAAQTREAVGIRIQIEVVVTGWTELQSSHAIVSYRNTG